MKPDYALSLSFEGISLFARAAGGWRVAGEVSLDASDLGAALADLRQRAVDLGGPAFRSKLIIPNDQIRYLTVDTGHVSTADRIDQVRGALDGATPYAVEDLVYDICVDGPLTHVAAVARETLEEAETFAQEHRFHPVSFVAIPGDAAFLGEPFFGPTQFSHTALASGERVEPDGVAVVVVGPIETVEAAPTPVDAALMAEPSQPADRDPLPDASEATAAKPAPSAFPIPPAPEPVATGMAEDQAPLPGFSSRRGPTRDADPAPATAPALGGAKRSTIAPRIEDTDDAQTGELDPAALAASLDAPAEEPAQPAEPAAKTWAARFLSRRGTRDAATAVPDEAAAEATAPAPSVAAHVPEPAPAPVAEPRAVAMAPAPAATMIDPAGMADERTRMTIFGMRESAPARGAPRHLGLILTAVLLLFLAGVAAWASVFMEDGVASFFERDEPVRAAQVPKLPDTAVPVPAEPDSPSEDVAALDSGETGLTDTDAAVLDALRQPEPAVPTVLDPAEADARYAVTGIWQRAPEAPDVPGVVTLDDLYLTSIDGSVDARDAVALPGLGSFDTDTPLGQIISPVGPGSEFAFDENGRIIPTAAGALSPDGFTVFLGRPPVVPPATPTRFETTPETDAVSEAIITVRPRLRPGDLVEQSERTQLGGLTREELSDLRPRLRPLVEKTEDEADETPTAQAVFASVTPRQRPQNMARIVDQADRVSPGAIAPAPTQVASAAATVTPRIPSTASVARAATVNNAINLRRVNLIGVYGTPSNRRALVRMPNGRYKKVQVGDRLDGGRISAIGDSELRYQKNGRNLTLKMPSG